MSDGLTYIGIKQHLSRRLLPLAIIVGLLLALCAPVTYWIIGHNNIQHMTDLYAEDLAGKFRSLTLDSPGLWKYQTYKFITISDQFHPPLDLLGFCVLDENGKVISGFESGDSMQFHSGKLSFLEELKSTRGTAPIVFNNQRVGSVQVMVSDKRLQRANAYLFGLSTLIGACLAILMYRFPTRVVGGVEKTLAELFNKVQRSENKYRSLVSNIPDVIWSADQQGNTVYISPNLQRLFGYSPEEVRSDPSLWFGRIHPDDLEKVKDAFVSLFIQGGTFDVEYRLRRKDGEWIWLHDRSIGTYENNGRVYADGIVSDITERKRIEAALVAQGEELARSNAELEQFAYVASHDLQEPLRMVASYVQLLARRYQGKLDEDADEFIAFAVDGANRMQRLISDLLMYSRVGAKRKELHATDCNDVVHHALDNLQESIRETGAQIRIPPLPTVMGDDIQLLQLFQNLLGNAVKFHGNDPPRVDVAAEKQEGEWLFSIRDNGIGIDARNFDRIFQIFQRLHSRTSYPGTGIGLAICKKIVERHGGRIWVESEEGRGTTFYFTLPALEENPC
jgi:PAS domain S-box-containing protein